MAIRNMRSINELELPAFSQVFKQFREISEQTFSSLFVAAIEQIIMYCRGSYLDEFFQTVFGMLSEEQLETCKEHFSDVFEDFEELIQKKQMRILASMIYDYNFTNLLTNICELIEVPMSKSSENEDLNELIYLCSKMRISFIILTPKWKESKFLLLDPFISINILTTNNKFFILYPVEYQALSLSTTDPEKPEAEEDMRKINSQEDSEDPLRSYSSGYTRNIKRGLSVEFSNKLGAGSEDSKEARMRNRAKLLKAKREQKRQEELRLKLDSEKKAEQDRIEKEKAEMELLMKEENELREKIRLEEENRLLKLWKKMKEDQMNGDETEVYLNEELENKACELKYLEDQRKEAEEIIKAKDELLQEIKNAEEIIKNEERKLAEEIALYEQKKVEFERSVNEEKRVLEMKKVENEKKIAKEIEKIEEKRKADLKEIEKEFLKIDERRLAQDKKIAEEKRLAAEKKLEDYKRLVHGKGCLNEARATPINIFGDVHKRNASFNSMLECVKVAEIEISPKKPSEKSSLTIKEEFNNTNREPRTRSIGRKLSQIKAKKLERPLSSFEKTDEHKEETVNSFEKAKQVMELRKIELEKILKDKKQLEIKRDAQRKKTTESLIYDDKVRIAEIIKKEEERKLEKEKNKKSPEKINEIKNSIDEILVNFGIKNKLSPDNLNESIEDVRKKYEEKMIEVSAFNLTNNESPAKEVKIIDNFSDIQKNSPNFFDDFPKSFENSPISYDNSPKAFEEPENLTINPIIKLEKVPETEEISGNCDNKTICGGLYCAKCIKDLKKSNFILKCSGCCKNYWKHPNTLTNKPVTQTKKLICMNCQSKILKGEEIYCLCCFIQVVVYKKGRVQCGECSKAGSNFWVDASEGCEDDLRICNFCNEKMHKDTVVRSCEKCQDFVCFVCLRRNSYISQGICSICHNRRQISIIYT